MIYYFACSYPQPSNFLNVYMCYHGIVQQSFSFKELLKYFYFFFQVEEIEDVDGNSDDPFVADAIANERELALSEEQRKNFRKVCQYLSNSVFIFCVFFSIFLVVEVLFLSY